MRVFRHPLSVPLAAFVALGIGHAGCSVLFVDAPPPKPPAGCTTSYLAPIADALIAVAGIATGAYILAHGDNNAFMDMKAAGGAGLTTGIIYGISSGYGFGTVSKCHSYGETLETVPAPK